MTTALITIREYCGHYQIEPDFLVALEQGGLLAFTRVGEEQYIAEEQLPELETYIHFHYDLDINVEGIDAIRHLLLRVKEMDQEIHQLRNRLSIHE
ncbi:chaperone modulator CbpM [Pedobacter duraquae]|uniref:MerR-like DNA binding protein n=1 Tax=Pedobacter duraquae TaxID=425511 RepID=A0A4R6IFV7_9SPHI|nr:chaperone modulator CbpM [Pedobacter duraquae]TDO20992.1 MerR-like DNA binding protein [Pedobacter duraquae]